MRVLAISWEFPPYVVGGMGKHAADLVPALGGLTPNGEPIYIDVLTTRYAGGPATEQFNEYITIHRVDVPPINLFDLYNSVMANNQALYETGLCLGEEHHYDVIHAHDWLPGEASIRLKHAWKTPLIVTIHATERGRHQGYLQGYDSCQINQMEWRLCFEAWRIIVCSEYMAYELNFYFGTPLDKTVVIPNGINFDTLHTCSPALRAAIRKKYAPDGERLLFFVGRITHEKGPQVVIEAMPQILKEYPRTHLLMAGKNSQNMRSLAQKLGVENAITFLGFVTDEERDHLYQAVDVAIFPSLYEPFGIVALEAMSLGCNVIASDVGGLGEVVRHMQNGLTTFPNDPASIAWAVRHLFEFPAAASQRQHRAREWARRRYHWRGIAEQTSMLFQDIVTERQTIPW